MCLADMYEGRVGVLEISDFAAHLPRGGAVSEWNGGWGSLTAEAEAMTRLEYLLQVQIMQAAGKKQRIPEPQPPKSLRDAERVVKTNRANRARVKAMAAQGWR